MKYYNTVTLRSELNYSTPVYGSLVPMVDGYDYNNTSRCVFLFFLILTFPPSSILFDIKINVPNTTKNSCK